MRFYRLLKNKTDDNTNISLEELKAKFTEEAAEVIESMSFYIQEPKRANLFLFFTEIMDVLQVVVAILFRIRELDMNYQDELDIAKQSHHFKLENREWEIAEEFFEVKHYEKEYEES